MPLLVLILATLPSRAQEADLTPLLSAPRGPHIQLALATLTGNGLQIGALSARTVYTREVMVLADLDPLWRDTPRRARVVLMPAVSLRLFGFERLVGGAAYRGFDVDLGLRAGPGLSFAANETTEERNRRFELVIEPFLRLTMATGRRMTWLVEVGSARPSFRLGMWIRY